MKKTILFSILLLALASAASAQKMYEPQRGSAVRTSVMDAIRAYDSKRDANHANEVFNVSALPYRERGRTRALSRS